MSGSAIPASQIVSVLPSVLNAGGVGIDLLGLLITTDNHTPVGEVYSFPDLISVQRFYGPTSYMAMLAGTYFLADTNATKRPGALLVSTYGNSWLPAWVMSAPNQGLTLDQIRAIDPASQISLNIGGGANVTSAPISMADVGSYSEAAMRLGAAIHRTVGVFPDPRTFTPVAGVLATCSGTTLNITTNNIPIGVPAITTQQTIGAGDVIQGTGFAMDTYIVRKISGTGITGVFEINKPHTQGSPQNLQIFRNPCTWDAQSWQFKIAAAPGVYKNPAISTISAITSLKGNAATVLRLTPALGATIQPLSNVPGLGVPFVTPAGWLDLIVRKTQNWACFATAFEPDAINPATGLRNNAVKQQFAAWTNAQQNNYMYVCWDNDATAAGPASGGSGSLARILDTALTSGTAPIYSPLLAADGVTSGVTTGRNLAMFMMGVVAAIDFNRLNGRKTLAFRGATGITPDITDGGIAKNLEANKYNYYGIWTTANDLFRFLYPGVVSGPYKWIDSYINQIWMNNGFQLALMELLTTVGSIPYNQVGYTMIKAACQDVINRALNFGAIRTGVTLSQAQINEVNNMAGVAIDGILNSQGYYLQVSDADPQVRANRGTPPCTFWYMDGGSVQRITLASVMVQ
jgi:hypothetical protein